MEELLDRDGIKVLRYDGKMSRKARDNTVEDFKNNRSNRVLIISLKCGGVGLNLVNANRCINLDLAWNNATEVQVSY